VTKQPMQWFAMVYPR